MTSKFVLTPDLLTLFLPPVLTSLQLTDEEATLSQSLIAVFNVARAGKENAARILQSGVVPSLLRAFEKTETGKPLALKALVVLSTHCDISAYILANPEWLQPFANAMQHDSSIVRRDATYVVRHFANSAEGCKCLFSSQILMSELKERIRSDNCAEVRLEAAIAFVNLLFLLSVEEKTWMLTNGYVEELFKVVESDTKKNLSNEEERLGFKVAVDGIEGFLDYAQYATQVGDAVNRELIDALKASKLIDRLLGLEVGPENFHVMKPLLDRANAFQFEAETASTFYEDEIDTKMTVKQVADALAPPIPAKAKHETYTGILIWED